jgi:periplasmic protein TonB
MKLVTLAVIAAAIVVPNSTKANTSHSDIIVAAPSVAEWATNVGAGLRRNLSTISAKPLRHTKLPDGLVAVRFKCSEDGTASAIEIAQNSSSSNLNAAARRAVSRLRHMHPLPAGIGENQVYEAVISVASDSYEFDRQMAKYREARAQQGRSTEALAIVITSAHSARAS